MNKTVMVVLLTVVATLVLADKLRQIPGVSMLPTV